MNRHSTWTFRSQEKSYWQIESALRSYFREMGLCHCRWGFLENYAFRELTVKTVTNLVTSSWTDGLDSITLSVHLWDVIES